ncbi:MAG: argininosuccinate lyase, partial [Maritimibacter sp.]|nr:argininosuccinate lyase [Maritimibacter sp.]
IEHMRHLASVTVGRCDTIVNTMHNTPFTDMNDSEGEVQQAGYAAFDSGGRVLELLAAMLPACSINADRVRRTTEAACITITELADTLVRDEWLSFRQAHEIAAHTARTVIRDGIALGQGYAAFTAAFRAETGRDTALDPAAFETATAPETFVARRDRPGGPAPAALDRAFATYRESWAHIATRRQVRHTRLTEADTALGAAFDRLLET